MPTPLKPGEDIYIDYKELPGDYAMPSIEAALDHYTLGYSLSGDRKYFTHTKIYYAHGETIGFGLPNVYHRNMPMSDTPYKRYLIKYKKEVLLPVIDLIGENEFQALHTNYMNFPEESLKLIRPQFENMLDIYNSKSNYAQFMLKNMLQNLVLTIYQRKPAITEDSLNLSSFHQQIYDALIYVEQNLAGDLSLELVAERISLSPSYFSRLFKNTVGCSFSEYVTRTRLQYAKLLMANEKLSVSEVAERCGFNNSNYFSTIFKKYNQVSPKEYYNT